MSQYVKPPQKKYFCWILSLPLLQLCIQFLSSSHWDLMHQSSQLCISYNFYDWVQLVCRGFIQRGSTLKFYKQAHLTNTKLIKIYILIEKMTPSLGLNDTPLEMNVWSLMKLSSQFVRPMIFFAGIMKHQTSAPVINGTSLAFKCNICFLNQNPTIKFLSRLLFNINLFQALLKFIS